jgi:hypothetical protein
MAPLDTNEATRQPEVRRCAELQEEIWGRDAQARNSMWIPAAALVLGVVLFMVAIVFASVFWI